MGFDLDIHYKPGLENKAANALSRKNPVPELFSASVPVAIQLEEVDSEVERDTELAKIIQDLKHDPTQHPDYELVQGRLLRQRKLVVPKSILSLSCESVTTVSMEDTEESWRHKNRLVYCSTGRG